jgi:hypothetical protein
MTWAFGNKLRGMAVSFNVSTNTKVAVFRDRVLGEKGKDRERKWRESRERYYILKVEQNILSL